MKLLSRIWKFIEAIFSAPKLEKEPKLVDETKPDLDNPSIIEINSTSQTVKKESAETILSHSLLKRAITHYNSVRINDFVVKPSLPVLYFGDLKNYLASETKVISVSLNPSSAEFMDRKNDTPSYFRFPDYEETAESLETSLSNYFKEKPYREWFGNESGSNSGFLPVLDGMGFSYYDLEDKETAIHTDLCSPIATNPTWSYLNKNQQDLLLEEGFHIWKKLIGEIKPNIIVMSTRKKYLEQLNPTFIKRLEYKESNASEGRTATKYTVEYYEVEIDGFKTNLVWGSSQNEPFMPFSNKREIGKKIISFYNTRKLIDIEEETVESEPIKIEQSQNYAQTYFKLDKRWYGQKRVVQVNFIRGSYQKQAYVYDHDFVYDNTVDHLNTLNCWENDGYYSSSSNIPGWAKDFVQKIDN
jgi:hypothetical protein